MKYRKKQDQIVNRGNQYKDKFDTNITIIEHLQQEIENMQTRMVDSHDDIKTLEDRINK